MAEQDLHGAKIACGFVDQRRLGPSHRVRAILASVEADRRDPFIDEARILPCAQMTEVIDPAWEYEVAYRPAAPIKPCFEALACLGHDLELHRTAGLLLDDRRAIAK